MEPNRKAQINRILKAMNKSIRKIYEDAASKNLQLPISDENGQVIYIDPKTVLNK